MHLTTTGTKHMTVVIRTTLAISCHLSTSNTNLTATDSHSTSTSTFSARSGFAISIKGECAHRTHSATAIDIVNHMTTVDSYCSITTHDTGIKVEVSLTICPFKSIRTAARTIDITTRRIACS